MELSKSKRSGAALAIAALVMTLAGYQLSRNVEVGLTSDADAESQAAVVAVACTDPAPNAFMPKVTYTIAWPAAAAPSLSIVDDTAITTEALSNNAAGEGAVNSDAAQTVHTSLNTSTAGYVVLSNLSPKMKIGGLQCQTSTSEASLLVHGDGNNNLQFDVAISNIVDNDTGYTSADKVDTTSSPANGKLLFGAVGDGDAQIFASRHTDGSTGGDDQDDDALLNGEIAFGSAEVSGGTEMHSIVDVTNYNVSAGTDAVTLTWVFTTF